ncbi:hypothetical protein E2C01_036176 [Portunus trituberculatus]|uniref:Uncharacterized protein n=1 Tax=Portunus trituberculatus TaxID=210409 RepID=A0A5B7FBS0_PORTR|nr:hypothetical protein [Portunus trituberculatus]
MSLAIMFNRSRGICKAQKRPPLRIQELRWLEFTRLCCGLSQTHRSVWHHWSPRKNILGSSEPPILQARYKLEQDRLAIIG